VLKGELQSVEVNPFFPLKGCHEIEAGQNWWQLNDQKNLGLLKHILLFDAIFKL
jgi:hypothetical protein